MEVFDMEIKKVMVFGTPGSGKGDALKRICSKLIETVSMDYGTAIIENTKIHFFSPAEDEKFSFMNEVLSKNLDGTIIFLNNSQKINDKQIKGIKKVMGGAPSIIFTNTTNKAHPYLNTSKSIPVIYTDEDQSTTIDNGIKTLLKMMSQLNVVNDIKQTAKE
jgi:signal recognition particle receptor subunit beta